MLRNKINLHFFIILGKQLSHKLKSEPGISLNTAKGGKKVFPKARLGLRVFLAIIVIEQCCTMRVFNS